MIKSLFLTILVGVWPCLALGAQTPVGDQEFMQELDRVKNPFEDGFPKPVVIMNMPVPSQEVNPVVLPQPKSAPVASPPVILPALRLQGVIVGEDIHQAIIDDQVVPLHGTIKGVRVDSVTKQGVGLFFEGKKFFLKVD